MLCLGIAVRGLYMNVNKMIITPTKGNGLPRSERLRDAEMILAS
jgi:hypothetical protein